MSQRQQGTGGRRRGLRRGGDFAGSRGHFGAEGGGGGRQVFGGRGKLGTCSSHHFKFETRVWVQSRKSTLPKAISLVVGAQDTAALLTPRLTSSVDELEEAAQKLRPRSGPCAPLDLGSLTSLGRALGEQAAKVWRCGILAGVWGSGMSANACPLTELGSLTSLGRVLREQLAEVWRWGVGGGGVRTSAPCPSWGS